MKNIRIALAFAGAATVGLSSAVTIAAEADDIFYGVQMEEFEYRYGDGGEKRLVWDGDAFVGTDELKFRLLSKGEYDTDASEFETLENQLVAQIPISDFFDLKGGVRLDTPAGQDRWYGVLGLSGLAPQWFEVDADFFLSETGDTSARVDIEYELLLTNRLILTPSLELDMAFSEDAEIGVGSGFNSAELGLRLSYDLIDRAVSPYLGIVYVRKFGDTADFAKAEGEDTETWFGVVGLKLRF